MRRSILAVVTHLAALGIGFALGVYYLPILTAPDSPDAAMLEAQSRDAVYSGTFERDLRGSDLLHWGEGTVSVSPARIVHMGKLAPGPDYRLYLVPEFVAHEDEFLPLKDRAALVGEVRTFEGLLLDIPEGVDIESYNTVLIWCEAFGEFITAARYR